MVHSIPEREYLRQEVLELENELELAEKQGIPIPMLDEIKKELWRKKDRLNFITNKS